MPLRYSALRRTRLIAGLAAWLALVVGALGFAGWVLGSASLKTALASNVTMKANAAIALCMTSCALLLLLPKRRSRVWQLVGKSACLVVTLLGAGTLSEHLVGWDLGIDQLFFTEPPGEAATASPGRMGPPASLTFTLLGMGVFSVDQGTRRGPAVPQLLALVACLMPLLALLGYTVNATQLYGIAKFTGIALHTAIGLLLLAIGLFLARAEREPAALLVADNPGGEVARTMLPLAVFLPIVFGWLRTQGELRGFYGPAFGRALLLLSLIVVLALVVWRLARRLSFVARQRANAERASSHARAEANRLALENLRTLSVLEALLAHAPVGLLFFDRERHCVRMNEFLTRALAVDGARPDCDVHEVLLASFPGLDETIELVFSHGASTRDVEISFDAGADTERSWLAGFFPVIEASGEVSLCGAVLMEITEQRRLAAQRTALLDSERAARVEAERAAALKDQFLATLSHELRTPLNAILGWARLARQSPQIPPNLERPLETIERNARIQAKLIEDLLDVSRIVSGKMRLAKELVDLRSVVQSAQQAAAPTAEAKHIQIEFEAPGDLPPVMGDAARLQQAISNLLSNALKFTAAHGHVRLELRRRDAVVECCVSDDGIGIDPEFLPHVFDRFRQGDASTTRRHGGLGLGLAIVKQLIELHGGSVSVASSGLRQGSSFTLSLPCVTSAGPVEATKSAPLGLAAPLPDKVLTGVRVLVVDDEADAREFVGRVLSEVRASVSLASSVDEALAVIERDPGYIVVSDISMPGKDGFDLIRAVRQRYGAAALPAIAVTAFARTEDRNRAIDAGFQIHIAKPVDPREIALAVAQLSGRVEANAG